VRRGRSPLLIGALIVGALVVVALLAPLLAPYDPHAIAGDSQEPPSGRHLLGTNDIGQDILSQVVWGARASLSIALPAAALAVVLGVLVGVGCGLLDGVAAAVATRGLDVVMAVPALPLIVLVVALVGPSRLTVLAVIGLLGWPATARIVRSQTLTLRRRGFVAAARGFGGGPWYVLRRHLVPGQAGAVVALFVTHAAAAVFLENGLSFLGAGDPTIVSWGQVLSRAMTRPGLFNTTSWVWWVLPPGLAITATVLGLSMLGTGLEPRFNPRARRSS
jgi:peptide/nickel transport system permease protein